MSTPLVTDYFISITDVMQRTSIKSKTTIYSLINKKKFPKPYPVTVGRRAWSAQEVAEWIESRKSAA